MSDELSADDIHRALATLGRHCRSDTRIILAGSVALMLQQQLRRVTKDGDVIEAHPDFGTLRDALRSVAAQEGIPDHWLNDSARAYLEVLPPDFRTRLRELGPFGRLRVALVSRRDAIVMKCFAHRAKDLLDLQEMAPTAKEIGFVLEHVARLRQLDPKKTAELEALIAAWSVPPDLSRRGPDIRRRGRGPSSSR